MPISNLTKEQLEQYVKESTNWKELMTKCGYTNFGCRTYLKKKLEVFNINISHFVRTKNNKRYTNDEIFKENSKYTSMANIKNKLIKQYNWKYECSNCKLSEWMGQKIPIEIDHINGNHIDNRIENLRFLCPNCHALTDTYKGKNIKNKEHSKEIYNNIVIKTTCKSCGNKKYKKSEYCRKCHIKIKLHKTNNINKCVDCNSQINKKVIRCIPCSNKIIKIDSTKVPNKCIDCNKHIYNTASRCVECHLINSRKVERPSYEQLIKDKETLNMVQIGKKYNVSDNTIRNWIKYYKNINNIHN